MPEYENTQKICPFVGSDCNSRCALYLPGGCAVKVIAERLASIDNKTPEV